MNANDRLPIGELLAVAMAGVIVFALVALGVRLKELQVDGAATSREDFLRQSIRRVQTEGRRGRILDRNGVELAANRNTHSVVCDAAWFQRRSWRETANAITSAASRVSAVMGLPYSLDGKSVQQHLHQRLAMPLVVWRDVRHEHLARFLERQDEFPGFFCSDDYERQYPRGSLAAHLIGYVGRDRADAGSGGEKFNYTDFEMRGRSGVESFYDRFLRGTTGVRMIRVDARGYATEQWTDTMTEDGPDLRLAVDVRIQQLVERELAGYCGACAVMDPRTGDVLALASAPAFDLNRFIPRLLPQVYAAYHDDPSHPLVNRAVGGLYAPGSTFKPVTALAGLAAGVPASVTFDCCGFYDGFGMRLRCSRRWGHGPLSLCGALRDSCNPYFCNLGVDIGTNQLIQAARALGLGAKTGVDFSIDSPGTVPDEQWKLAHYHEKWMPGDLAQMSIGQGMLLVTPLQMARAVGAIGTGYLVRPRIRLDASSVREALPFSAASLATVRKGMRMVVDGGTGRRGGEDVDAWIIGKTGTAEVGSRENRRKNTWFVAYAEDCRRGPKDEPQRLPAPKKCLAIAMVIENGDTGGGTTAPKVAAVLRGVFGEHHLEKRGRDR